MESKALALDTPKAKALDSIILWALHIALKFLFLIWRNRIQ